MRLCRLSSFKYISIGRITSLHNWPNEEIQVDYDLIEPLCHVYFSVIAD